MSRFLMYTYCIIMIHIESIRSIRKGEILMTKQKMIRVTRLEKILKNIEATIPLMRDDEAKGAKTVIGIIRDNLKKDQS